MDDEAHVRLVDAHAEGDRRHHRKAILQQKAPLAFGARARIEAGMIGERGQSGFFQRGGDLPTPSRVPA
jgi:hypothetical protein